VAKPFVQLLGRAGARIGPDAVDFLPERRYQLLAYLAYAGTWVSRDQLAYLFWPNVATQTARGNLRSLLERVRELGWVAGLETDRHRVRWCVDTDVAAMLALLDRSPAQADDAENLVAIYAGPLLTGLEAYDESEFANWLEIERGQVHARWREGLMRRVEALAPDPDAGRALTLIERLLVHDPLDEEAVRQALAAGGTGGSADRALRIYRAFAKHLQRELGLDPADATSELARRLEQDAASQPAPAGESLGPEPRAAPPPVVTCLPVPATSFVGREREREEIAGSLARPECRLLTLVGVGGVGKTRLAIEVAASLRGRYEGQCFVPLETLTLPEGIAGRIAEALDLEAPGPDPLSQVVAHLAYRRVLLLLDSFEHVIDGAVVVSTVLARCPNVDVLATSRERLDLSEEWVYPIEGLSFPGAADATGDPRAFDAVKLFAERAKRHSPRWSLDDEAEGAARLCRLVEGNPLAIELAAVWVRLLRCSEIVAEIESNVDFLAASTRNAAERHTSIRATFEHSWRLLTRAEQDGLRKLSVFRGGFTRAAAQVVAAVPIPVLASLVDKSLLRVASDSRYDRHPLLDQFTREKLAERPDQEALLEQRHAEYHFRQLIEWGARLHGPQRAHAMAVLTDDVVNALAAWRWAITHVRVRELQEATAPLHRFFALQYRGREGAEVFGAMVSALSEANPEHRAALGYALVSHGYFLDPDDPRRAQVLHSGLELLRPLQDGTGMMWGLYVLALAAAWTGEREGAEQFVREALALATAEEDDRARGDCLTNLARLLQEGGEYAEADRFAREALDVWRSLGDQQGETWALMWSGLARLRSGALDEAEEAMGHALRSAGEREDALQVSLLTAHHGLLAHARGELEVARERFEEALGMTSGALEEAFTEPMYLADLGRVETDLGRLERAEHCFATSLQRALPHRWLAHLASALAGVARLRARQGRHAVALELAFLVRDHAATEHAHREQMRHLIDVVRAAMPADERESEPERSPSRPLEEVARSVLRDIGVPAAGPGPR
jgi:predicted ATPase/DNA-binding SARP family transcriptional activator